MTYSTSLNQKAHSSQDLLILSIILKDHFIGKVGKLRHEMPTTTREPSYLCIKYQIMKETHCNLEFCKVIVGEVEK